MSIIHIEKQEDIELSVPTEWRTALKNLAEFFVLNDPLIQEERVSVDQDRRRDCQNKSRKFE